MRGSIGSRQDDKEAGEPMMNDDVALFLDHLALERGLAANSLAAYRRDLRDHLAFLREECGKNEVAAVGESDIIRYLSDLHHRGTATATISRKLTTVKQFYRYLVAERRLGADPTANIEAPRMAKKLPVTLTLEEVERLLAASDVSTLRGLRDRALLEVLYATGLRVSELVNSLFCIRINLDDICSPNNLFMTDTIVSSLR